MRRRPWHSILRWATRGESLWALWELVKERWKALGISETVVAMTSEWLQWPAYQFWLVAVNVAFWVIAFPTLGRVAAERKRAERKKDELIKEQANRIKELEHRNLVVGTKPGIVKIFWDATHYWETDDLRKTCDEIIEWLGKERKLPVSRGDYGTAWYFYDDRTYRRIRQEQVILGRITPDIPRELWIGFAMDD